jgi:hypothetical protein
MSTALTTVRLSPLSPDHTTLTCAVSVGQLVDVCRHFQNKAELGEAAEVDSYGECWHAVAVQNTEVLDALEGWLYRSPDLVTFKALLQRYEYPSYSDDMVREILQKVKGTLVLWPSEFLINEFML